MGGAGFVPVVLAAEADVRPDGSGQEGCLPIRRFGRREGTVNVVTTYDSIGATYVSTRRADPRIAARIEALLRDARTVVNVGAGTGSYEPPRTALAVEPSPVMIAQRPAGTAPVCGAPPNGCRCAPGPRMP